MGKEKCLSTVTLNKALLLTVSPTRILFWECHKINHCFPFFPPGSVNPKPCRPGLYCGSRTAVPSVCPAGYYCPEGSSTYNSPEQLWVPNMFGAASFKFQKTL